MPNAGREGAPIRMSRPRRSEDAAVLNSFQFNLPGLIIFSLALIAGALVAGWALAGHREPSLITDDTFRLTNPRDNHSTLRVGPWGVLSERDIELERPAEFLTSEVKSPEPEVWIFRNQTPDSVKQLLTQNGVPSDQLAVAWAKAAPVLRADQSTAWQPPLDFLLGLDSAVRARLYAALAGQNINLYLDYPYIFPKGTVEAILTDPRLDPADIRLLKQLLYPNGQAQQLVDYQALLCAIPDMQRRVRLSQSLSRQKAVLAGLLVTTDTDIDKLAAYWGQIPNVRFTDLRPLFEAVKALPEGGGVSLVYLLPSFARNRLYTFPLPPQPGDPVMDCHWTTFNFSNDKPDNRFNDPQYAIKYINDHYYPIAAPSLYGDVLLLMNEKNEIKHSAIFLADDLVYTKNGNNFRQPWMVMHIPDLLDTYPAYPPMRAVYLRRKED